MDVESQKFSRPISRLNIERFRVTLYLFSRYHNERPLQEVTSGNRAHLFIRNVTGAQGLYICKATNDYRSEISTPAELKIKGMYAPHSFF